MSNETPSTGLAETLYESKPLRSPEQERDAQALTNKSTCHSDTFMSSAHNHVDISWILTGIQWDPVHICELLGLCRRLHNWTRRCFKMEAFSSASESSDHHQQNLKKDCFHSLVWYEGCTKWPVFHLRVQSGELVLTPGRKNVSAAPRYRWMERMDGGLSAAAAPSMAFWAPWFHKVLLCWWTPFDDFLLRVYPPILHYPAQLSFQVCTCRQMRWFGLHGICF